MTIRRWAGIGGLSVVAASLLAGVLLAGALLSSQAATAQEPLTLRSAWSNVVYDGETMPVELALTNVAPVVESIWHWDAAGQVWDPWFRDVPVVSTLAVLETGEAYWIRVSATVEWVPNRLALFATAMVLVESEGTGHLLEVELADSPALRSRGLMFRQDLAAEGGMLFLFPNDTQGGFWMQNTFVPLSIAFIDAVGVIVDIQEMEPLTTNLHAPPVPYRWALEVNQGWFATNGVSVGDVVGLTGT